MLSTLELPASTDNNDALVSENQNKIYEQELICSVKKYYKHIHKMTYS